VSVRGVAIKFGIFAVVMVVILAMLVVVFGQFRFGDETGVRAEFSSASGLKKGEKVRVAGVDAGRVTGVKVVDDERALVSFTIDSAVRVNGGSRATIKYQNLIGDRYLEISDGPGDPHELRSGATIPRDRTSPALDLDALIGGFRPLLKAIDPQDVNGISQALIEVFQGQGSSVGRVLRQIGQATERLADEDQLIGSVIENLNGVLSTVRKQNDAFDQGVDSLQQLISGLGAQSDRIAQSVASMSRASRSVASLLDQSRPAIAEDVTQVRRFSEAVNGNSGYVDRLLGELPQSYRALSRLGLYGAFFTFYLCDATLKVNGPKGDPVYIDIIGQRAGRCAPL